MPAPAVLDADLSDAEDQALLPPVAHAHHGDDDQIVAEVQEQRKRLKPKKLKKDDPQLLEQQLLSYHKTQLRRVVSAKCKCRDAHCRQGLRNNFDDFDRVVQERVRLHGSPKLDADQFVFQALKRDRDGDGHWHVQGHRVCKRAYALIMGIGKSRLQKMTLSISKDESCPIDGRFGQPKENQFLSPSSARPLCMDFLEKIYHELAEPMPDARDDGQNEGIKLQFKRRGKRPRHRFKRDDLSRDQIKFLPPGTILDYLELCRAENPKHKIGRTVFCRAFW